MNIMEFSLISKGQSQSWRRNSDMIILKIGKFQSWNLPAFEFEVFPGFEMADIIVNLEIYKENVENWKK